MELVLVRHALPNRMAAAQGQPDPHLGDVGTAQAAVLADLLGSGAPISAIYSSTMLRARQTVAPLAKRLGLDVLQSSDLVELTLGETDYVPIGPSRRSSDARRHLAEWRSRMGTPEGAAAVRAFQRRVCWRLTEIASVHPGQCVVVGAHGGVISAYVTDLLGIDDAMTFSFGYTSLTRVLVARDGRRTLRSLNEHTHVIQRVDNAERNPA